MNRRASTSSATRFLPVVALFLAVPVAAVIQPPKRPDCRPQSLSLGYSIRSSWETFDQSSLEASARLLFDAYAQPESGPPCRGRRSYRLNIALGSDYQILDWLRQGLIDGAIVPELTLHLLLADGLELWELDSAPLAEASGPQPVAAPVGVVLPASTPRFAAGTWAGDTWRVAPDPAGRLLQFRESILCRALDVAFVPPSRRTEEAQRRCEQGLVPVLAVMPSHLSNNGFVAPVASTQLWFEGRMESGVLDGGEALRSDVVEAFWELFMDSVRFSLDRDPAEPPGIADGSEILIFPGERALLEGDSGWTPLVPDPGLNEAEHLVLSSRAKRVLPFDASVFRPARAVLREPLPRLLGHEPPRAFVDLSMIEGAFGVRTYGFRLDESIRLLKQNRAVSEQASLAVLLPGGGVKAAYQSTLVDLLYGRSYLVNTRLLDPRPSGATERHSPLAVEHVIGTSGGALLGFFVAQLGESGPFDLSDRLWGDVDSTKVFGVSDLPRYLSVVVILFVFALFLSWASSAVGSVFFSTHDARRSNVRLPLAAVTVPVLVLAPILVGLVNGEHSVEQVPEIEGLLYAILAIIVMFADQCLVAGGERRAAPRRSPHWWHVPIGLGLVLVVVAVAGRWFFAWTSQYASFGVALAVFLPLFLVPGLIIPFRALDEGGLARVRPARVALDLLIVAVVSLVFLALFGRWWVRLGLPVLLVGLVFLLVVIVAGLVLRGLEPRRRPIPYYVVLIAAGFALTALCRPAGDLGAVAPSQLSGLFELLGQPSILAIHSGALLVSAGLLVLLVGGLARVYVTHLDYQLDRPLQCVEGLFVTLAYVVAVNGFLFFVVLVRPDWLSHLELTKELWIWLLATAVVAAVTLIWVGLTARVLPGAAHVRSGLSYLCSRHPNGVLISRRYWRLTALSFVVFAWWNLALAPALYGNRHAKAFLEEIVDRFYEQYLGGPVDVTTGYPLTAEFVAPANRLEADGTRYFVFSPDDRDTAERCPSLPVTTGAVWLQYWNDVDQPGATVPIHGHEACSGPDPDAGSSCRTQQSDTIRTVIFASGSPFPIFPANRVCLPEDGRLEWQALVDGGYTNDVPVDAALALGATQVLIVQSSNPLGHGDGGPGRLLEALRKIRFPGKLITNAGRLPAFLFERSQAVDRLSRKQLFVISLSPRREYRDWPPLTDFRRSTVERLQRAAQEDAEQRIGMVESWGEPRFPYSLEIAVPERDSAR